MGPIRKGSIQQSVERTVLTVSDGSRLKFKKSEIRFERRFYMPSVIQALSALLIELF